MKYRARWINAEGEAVRQDYFEWDPEKHPSYYGMRELVRDLALTMDSPYFNLRELQEHVKGYIEGAWRPWGYFIVNEEGMLLDGFHPNPSELVNPDELRPDPSYVPLFGPVVLVEIVP